MIIYISNIKLFTLIDNELLVNKFIILERDRQYIRDNSLTIRYLTKEKQAFSPIFHAFTPVFLRLSRGFFYAILQTINKIYLP